MIADHVPHTTKIWDVVIPGEPQAWQRAGVGSGVHFTRAKTARFEHAVALCALAVKIPKAASCACRCSYRAAAPTPARPLPRRGPHVPDLRAGEPPMIVKWRKDDNFDLDEGIYVELVGLTLTVWRVNEGWRAWVDDIDLGTVPTRREAKKIALDKARSMLRKALNAAEDEIARIEFGR